MNIKKYKNDIILFTIIITICLIMILIVNSASKESRYANVYYDGKIIKKIDLNINNTYNVKGYNGNVKIVVYNKKIKVAEENSPKHLCSKQGYINKSYESIICLPNKIVIEISGNDSIDTVVK